MVQIWDLCSQSWLLWSPIKEPSHEWNCFVVRLKSINSLDKKNIMYLQLKTSPFSRVFKAWSNCHIRLVRSLVSIRCLYKCETKSRSEKLHHIWLVLFDMISHGVISTVTLTMEDRLRNKWPTKWFKTIKKENMMWTSLNGALFSFKENERLRN